MEQAHGSLDQPLNETAFVPVALRPQILPDFVRLEEIVFVEKQNAGQVARIVGVHALILPTESRRGTYTWPSISGSFSLCKRSRSFRNAVALCFLALAATLLTLRCLFC